MKQLLYFIFVLAAAANFVKEKFLQWVLMQNQQIQYANYYKSDELYYKQHATQSQAMLFGLHKIHIRGRQLKIAIPQRILSIQVFYGSLQDERDLKNRWVLHRIFRDVSGVVTNIKPPTIGILLTCL